MKIEESIIRKLTMSLVELERKFSPPDTIIREYTTPKDKEEYKSYKSKIDEFGRKESYKNYNSDGSPADEGTINFPTKLIAVTEIISGNGDRDQITQEYNQNNCLVYESFQYGFDATKDEVFIKYNENGTIHSFSAIENIFEEKYCNRGYHFEYEGLAIKRIYRIEEQALTTIVKVSTTEETKEIIFLSEDEIERKLIFRFDEENRVIEEINIRYDDYANNEISSNCKTGYEYNNNGSLKREYFEDYDIETKQITDIEESQFDANGRIQKRTVREVNTKRGFIERTTYSKRKKNRG
ncbi:MAG: hypothetical protein AB8G15_15835 [Saprospiraceae bacterium]